MSDVGTTRCSSIAREGLLLTHAQVLTGQTGSQSQAAAAVPNSVPKTISEMGNTINDTLPKAYWLTQQHTEQLQNAFGDVRLLQALWQMKGDALNAQLRSS